MESTQFKTLIDYYPNFNDSVNFVTYFNQRINWINVKNNQIEFTTSESTDMFPSVDSHVEKLDVFINDMLESDFLSLMEMIYILN